MRFQFQPVSGLTCSLLSYCTNSSARMCSEYSSGGALNETVYWVAYEKFNGKLAGACISALQTS